MTKRQREILNFIEYFVSKFGYSPTLKEIAQHFNLSAVSTIHQHIENLIKEGYLKKTEGGKVVPVYANYELEKTVSLPFYGYIAAGLPIEAVPEVFEYIEVPSIMGCRNCYVLKVKGDSMVDEFILDGDLIVVENRQEALNGEIAVILIDGEEATLKKFYKEGNKVKLVPSNPKYKPMFYDAERVMVQGIVKGIIRSYNIPKKK